MRDTARRLLAKAGLFEVARHPSWHMKNAFRQSSRRQIEDYMAAHTVKKLHIGCAWHLMPGWLNNDLYPTRKEAVHFDATKTFPIPSSSFDYIFSEHMIEHLTYDGGAMMLRECYRVLKPGGVIRTSTPDLQFLIDLYKEPKSPMQAEYIKVASKWDTRSAAEMDTFVINMYMRRWGHLFIYDEKVLRLTMERAGFTTIRRCNLNESSEPALSNLEHEERSAPGFIRLETMTLEGTR
jgi:predicted SAM-dependent methyltransferase